MHHSPTLADEPTGAVDTKTGIEIMNIFQRLNRPPNGPPNRPGMTIVVVTHEPEIARFANRIIRFRDGRLLEIETVANPADAKSILAELAQVPQTDDMAA